MGLCLGNGRAAARALPAAGSCGQRARAGRLASLPVNNREVITFSFGFHSSLVMEMSEAQAITEERGIVKETRAENRSS